MKKIIHLISSLTNGGAETMVKDYAILTDKSKFEVKIISLDKSYDSANEKALEQAGIPVYYLSEMRFDKNRKLNLMQKVIRRIARYIDLYKILKKERPNILHVHLYIGNYLKIIPIKKWNMSLFYTVHNIPSRFFSTNSKDKEKYHAYKEVTRLLAKDDLVLIALHDEMKDELRDLFHTNRIITVNNGVNLDRYKGKICDRSITRSKIGIPANSFLIGHVGRFHEQKNHDLILDIFNIVWMEDEESYLLLVGNGPTRNRIEERINKSPYKKNIIILQNRDDIPELMNAMDVFLFPSRWEGFGNVMIEAQSIGLHCVVSNKIPNYAIINSNVEVLSLEDDLDKWVNAVKRKTFDFTSYQDIDDFDIKNSIRKLQEIYIRIEENDDSIFNYNTCI